MSYHIFLIKEENFKECVKVGIYGNIEHPNKKINADILATTAAIKNNDFIFFYVKNVGVYGLWKVIGEPFYDNTYIWDGLKGYHYRFQFTPIVRKFSKPVVLNDILDLRDKGKIWTFDLGSLTRKNQYTITTEEGKEIIRLLLRNNPVFAPVEARILPHKKISKRKILLLLECDRYGRLKYEGFLNAWFMKVFTEGGLKNLLGEYKDFLNYVPTSFNKVMDIFLTHVTSIDSLEILHKFTCIELKTYIVTEENLRQIIRYENWIARKLAEGDFEMVQGILVGFDFDEAVLEYCRKRRAIEEKTVRLIKYRVDPDEKKIELNEEA